MPRFDISEYEPVEDRLRKFWTDHPEGRVLTELIAYSDTQFILRAEVYVNREDTRPVATGIAEEQVTGSGVNRTSAAENGETSAIGRALANFGYATKGKRPSREEMQKVQRGATIRQAVNTKALTDEDASNLGELIASVAGMSDAELKAAWHTHPELLEVHVEGAGTTLADAILARKTELDAEAVPA